MKKVIITSKNPVKIQAVKIGFKKMFPSQKFEFIDIFVNSKVSNQPMSNDETFLGAKNRIDEASKKIKNADFYVGIEGGINQIKNEIEAFAWIIIKSKKRYGKAKSSTFFLPTKITKLINERKELGVANDIVFKSKNSKQKTGTVGFLTNDIITRTSLYSEAIILALIPFKKIDLYR